MRNAKPVEGFDYRQQARVKMTPKEWRESFPATIYRRVVENGETFYHRIGGRLTAEAYAVIPPEVVR